jgi:hypothetical protein
MAADKYTEVEFQAWEFVPDVTNGPQAITRTDGDGVTEAGHYDLLAFDSATDEYAYVPWAIPEDFDTTAGEMKVRVYYETAVTSGTAAWQLGIAGYADNEDLDAAYSNLTDIAAETVEGTARYLSVGAATTVDATALGALTKGDLAILRINRDVSADTAAGDVNLIKLVIQYKALGDNNASWSGTAAGSGEWYKELWFPAIKWVGDKTVPPALGTRTATTAQSAHYHFLAFDTAQDECAYATWRVPEDIDTSYSLKFIPYWEADATSGTVQWYFSLPLTDASIGDNEDINDTMDTGGSRSDAPSGTARNLNVPPSNGNSITDAAAGELIVFRMWRDVSADSMSGDARLIGVNIQYRTLESNNAAWS